MSDQEKHNVAEPLLSQVEKAFAKLMAIPRPSRTRKSFPPVQNAGVDEFLEALAREFNLTTETVADLRALRNYEIVLLCDDSGSMSTTVDGTQHTRWDELRVMVKIIILISTVFDQNGVDIYFLNRSALLRVTDPSQIEQLFHEPPSGYSNLAGALEYIFSLDIARPKRDKKMLVFVATDAEPTNQDDEEDLSTLEQVMLHKRRVETTFVMFLLCNDNPVCAEYLSRWDREMENVDVLDDYETEKQKVFIQKGADYNFTYGEYILKAMLGAIHSGWDMVGEVPGV